MRKIAAVLFLIALTGCATKEGIVLPSTQPTQADLGDFNRRNAAQPSTAKPSTQTSVQASAQPAVQAPGPAQISSSTPAKSVLLPDVDGAKLIVVGNAMALTVFDESVLNQRYDNYLKQLGGKPAAFTREWYASASAGETSVKFSGVTGLYTRFYRAEVPKDLVRQIGFASAFGTFMAGTSADLVAMQVHPGGYGNWITHVLCSEKDPKYAACAQQYRVGVYQSSDGQEVDGTLKVVEGGAAVDPKTFKLRAADAGQAAAPVKPAPAKVAPAAAAPASSQQATSPARMDEGAQLQKLNELLSKGLITQGEYEGKRKDILDRI